MSKWRKEGESGQFALQKQQKMWPIMSS